jgi:hypothetical protein
MFHKIGPRFFAAPTTDWSLISSPMTMSPVVVSGTGFNLEPF